MNCKYKECTVWYPDCGECDDCVDGRLIELVSEYASTCDGCGELTHHDHLEMNEKTQLGYCEKCEKEQIMSYAELKVAELNGPVITYMSYTDSWGGFAYIWDSIWEKYCKKNRLDLWVHPKENHTRLFGTVTNPKIPGWIRLIMASTFDNYIVKYDKLPILSEYYKDFVEMFPPPPKGCHLLRWSDDCMKIYNEYNSNNCAGICFQATSINPDPWEDYDLSKGDKHKFVFERYALRLGLKDK